MPQMAPLSWLSLFLMFSMIMIFYMIKNYFMISYKPSKNFKIMNKFMMNWKW